MFDEPSAVNHHDDVSQTFDADFGFAGRTDYLRETAGAELAAADAADASLRMQDELAAIEAARAADEGQRIERAEMLAAHHVVATAIPAAEVRIGKETVCRNWGTGPVEFRTVISCHVFGSGLEPLTSGVGDSPMAAAIRAVENYSKSEHAAA